jgi:hypothetical protein
MPPGFFVQASMPWLALFRRQADWRLCFRAGPVDQWLIRSLGV